MPKLISSGAASRQIAALLLASVSFSAMSSTARGAEFFAGSQAELIAAIDAANLSGDTSSTITLTAGFTYSGASLPAVTKQLTLDSGAHLLSGTGNAVWNVGAGATLTIRGATAINAGRLISAGNGTTHLEGASGNQAHGIEVASGTMLIDGGSQITAGISASWSSIRVSEGTLVLSGAGTKVTTNTGAASPHIGGTSGARMVVTQGAEFESDSGVLLANTATESGALSVSGANSLFNVAGLSTLRGKGVVTVTDQGEIRTRTMGLGGLGTGLYNSGSGTIVVSGPGSAWNNSGAFRPYDGTVDILAGGAIATSTLHIATAPNPGSMNSSVRVDGAGSRLVTTGAGANAFQIGAGSTSGARSGSLTIANGGDVNVASGAGTINMAPVANGRAAINIGGVEGQAATGAGTLAAGRIEFGLGTGLVNFNHTDAAYGFDVALDGNGTLNQVGSGKTILTADQVAFTGQTNVQGGILAVNGVLGGSMAVYGGQLQGTGTIGTTTNHSGGTIAPGNSIGVLTVAGGYTSAGGGLEIESVLGDDASAADLLLITGNSLLGLAPTLVSVVNVGGVGGATVDGIRIVEVQGPISDADAFVLAGPAIGGAYRYDLFQHDLATGSDGSWYLRSSGELAPTAPTLENYPVALLGMIELPTLRQRAGQGEANQQGIATRIEGSAGHHQAASSTAGAAYDSSMFLAQIGLSGRLMDTVGGSLTAGLTAQYSRHHASVFSAYGDGSNSTESFGLGASLTWRGAEGTYVDLQGQVARFNSDINAAGYSLVEGNAGAGFAAGIEAGHAFTLDDAWSLTPQAQLNYASVGFDKFTDRFGTEVSLNHGASLKGRLGLALDYESEWQDDEGRQTDAALYGITNLTYEFLDGASVVVSGTDLSYVEQRFGAELGLGGTLAWADGAHALHGELLGSTSFQGSYATKGTLGFTSKF